jgi:hypothetical protein
VAAICRGELIGSQTELASFRHFITGLIQLALPRRSGTHNGDRVFSEKRPVLLLEVHGEMLLPIVGSFLRKYCYLAWDVREFDQPRSTPFTDATNLQNAAATICNTLVCLPDELFEKRRMLVNGHRAIAKVLQHGQTAACQ